MTSTFLGTFLLFVPLFIMVIEYPSWIALFSTALLSVPVPPINRTLARGIFYI